MAVTLGQIAEKAGVSVAAVSKALNNKPDIAPATRRRIQAIARSMGYSVNVAGRALSARRTMAIGALTPFPQIPTVIERIRGVQAAATQRGFLSFISFHDTTGIQEIGQLGMMRSRIDGLAISPVNRTQELKAALERMEVPIVFVGEPTGRFVKADYVGDDDHEGGRLAGEHLTAIGRTKIAYLGAIASSLSDKAIMAGIREAVGRGPCKLLQDCTLWGNLNQAATAANVDRLLDRSPWPDAIMAFSDMAAMWAMKRLVERNVAIPGDIAVVGYDNTEFAALAAVPLTSVAQPNYQIGFEAATILLARILDGDTAPARSVVFPPELVVRESTGG